VWVRAVFPAAVGGSGELESQETAKFQVKSEVSLLHPKPSPVRLRYHF